MRVITYLEAAARAGIVVRTLHREIAKGEGPPIIFVSSRRRGILEADFEAWLQSRRHAAPGKAAAPDCTAAEEAHA